jgi:hypothetical protein
MLGAEHGDFIVDGVFARRACVLFVGDDMQLQPVAAGELLRPLSRMQSPHTLTENRRSQTSALAQTLRFIRGGVSDAASNCAKELRSKIVTSPSPSELLRLILERRPTLILALRNTDIEFVNRAALRELFPIADPRLRGLCDYRSERTPTRVFVPSEGMPVRFTNNRLRDSGACRGTLGVILSVEIAEEPRRPRIFTCSVALLSSPVDIFAAAPSSSKVLSLCHNLHELRFVVRPAFAITVHDAQGIETPRPAIVLPPSHRCPLLSAEILYTAASRARADFHIFETGDSFDTMASALASRTPDRDTPLRILSAR